MIQSYVVLVLGGGACCCLWLCRTKSKCDYVDVDFDAIIQRSKD